MVHSRENFEAAAGASQILFGQGTAEQLRRLDEKTFLSLFDGVPHFSIDRRELKAGINIVDLLTEKTSVFPSKAEVRRTIQANGLSLNKERVASSEMTIDESWLLGGKYLLAQKGKKNYFLLTAY
jgi:tyrosyl-tRNA synthetase